MPDDTRKMEPQADEWVGTGPGRGPANAPFPLYRGHVNIAREPQLDPGQAEHDKHYSYGASRGLILAAESGQRTTLRAVIANARVNDPKVLTGLLALTHAFGGFTATPVIGGWKDEHGLVAFEPGLAVEVSGPSSEFDLAQAREILATVGRDLGERWVHFEEHVWRAHHAQVNP